MDMGLALMISVGALSLFTFLSIVVYSESRNKERKEFYRSEMLRKVAEQSDDGADKVLEVIREEERVAQVKMREGLKLGGLITTMVGVGVGAFLYVFLPEAAMVGVIPLLVGLSMLAYVAFLSPRPE